MAMLALLVLATGTVSAAPRQQTVVNICSRTAEVQTAILAEVTGATCSTITDTQLASISVLDFDRYSAASIIPADFAGLTGLTALTIEFGNSLNTLPENAFSEVSSLRRIVLYAVGLSSVHENALDGTGHGCRGARAEAEVDVRGHGSVRNLPGVSSDAGGGLRSAHGVHAGANEMASQHGRKGGLR